MKKSILTKFLVFFMSVVMLTACSTKGANQGDNATSEENNITTEGDNTSNDGTLESAKVYVFIAASLSNAMETIQKKYNEIQPNVELIFNADSSGTLKTQIEEGAECDIFFSAAMKQMNELNEAGYIENDSIIKLLENQVVLIKPKGSETTVTGFDNITNAKNLALAGEDVPVGAYAREIFTNMGILDSVMAMEINECANVSAVLAAVSEASNEVGIVYKTDAYSALDSVEIMTSAPSEYLKTPVIYPVGMVTNKEADANQKNAAKDFLEFLKTDEAIKVFEEYGFVGYNE
ncbi:molybdate ABC transporter substrate-binding protein [Clostridium sp. Marseille-P299]|uniref:molybdate ABC transporter substrate-binding protein n=1 Tax=Clostridium sp. Marseille-P299 TaxID=1805477 RepID=UPI000835E85F|nr:molybdate ABC transporter substrate-binding protein [Clostridium sp. Marseille-P299]